MTDQFISSARHVKHQLFVTQRRLRSRVPVAWTRHWEYRRTHGQFAYIPGLKKPRSFSEKLLWRILRDRREVLKPTYDKLWMKEYGEHRGVTSPKTLWQGTDTAELAAASQNFGTDWVLKPNHLSGPIHFHSGAIDAATAASVTDGWLESRHAPELGEWATQFVSAQLLAEQSLARVPGEDVPDYKFFVFGGFPRAVQVVTGRSKNDTRHTFYSLPDWEWIDVTWRRPSGPASPPPAELPLLIDSATRLGAGWDFMRIDLYLSGGKVWLGELTPYPASAQGRFNPPSFDRWLGQFWHLPDPHARS